VPTWGEFEAGAPELAAAGRRLIHSRGDGEALLATVRDGQEPRIHPINVGIVGEHLYLFNRVSVRPPTDRASFCAHLSRRGF
jgi:hypothetical protein